MSFYQVILSNLSLPSILANVILSHVILFSVFCTMFYRMSLYQVFQQLSFYKMLFYVMPLYQMPFDLIYFYLMSFCLLSCYQKFQSQPLKNELCLLHSLLISQIISDQFKKFCLYERLQLIHEIFEIYFFKFLNILTD